LIEEDLKVISKIQNKINGVVIPKVDGPEHLVIPLIPFSYPRSPSPLGV
jgi:hypothetical protein